MKKGGIIAVIITAAVVLSAILTVFVIIPVINNMEAGALKDKSLQRYTYSRSGDMRGSVYEEEITVYNEKKALMTVTSKEWYDADDVVEKYFLDIRVLDDIRDIFAENNMRKWQDKNLSKVFIADGASHHYSFYFDEEDYYSFSSQHYETKYRKVLEKIDDAIESYAKEKADIQ